MRAWPLLLLAACGAQGEPSPPRTSEGARMERFVAIPPGSVPRGAAAYAAASAAPADPADPALLARGADRYAIFCAPCHGTGGAGDGPAVRRSYPRPPPLAAPSPTVTIAAIEQGAGVMLPMAGAVPPGDARAIAAWLARIE